MQEEAGENVKDDSQAITIDLSSIPTPEKVIEQISENDDFKDSVVSIEDFPPYEEEGNNVNILIKGRWLERGGSAWWISTAGTGKSVASVQLAYKWGAGLDFAGLQPHRKLKTWIVQSEDSPSRIAIDREDIETQLNEERPDIQWKEVGRGCVHFVKSTGNVGVDFLKRIDHLLTMAKDKGCMPDVLIINPFMAFVGGPVTDGGYVTPFLRGGEIAGEHTDGLQFLLEKHNVAALIFHHTPKPPPSNKDLESWLKTPFPEYQGAGSSDITNWGRSFITVMKMPDHDGIFCMCAGKNGNGIGWERIGGSCRRYMAWSDETGIDGGKRHAWRELNDEEYAEIVEKKRTNYEEEVEDAADKIAGELKIKAMNMTEIHSKTRGMPRKLIRDAVAAIKSKPKRFGLMIHDAWFGSMHLQFIGQAEGIRTAVKQYEEKMKIEATKEVSDGESFTIPF